MSLDLCILASGSAGNCAAVRTPRGLLLLDLGVGPRVAANRLAARGASLAGLAAVCLTHLDRDHFNPNWLATLVARGVRVFCHASRVDRLLYVARQSAASALAALICPFDASPFEALPGLVLDPIPLAHDADGSHGFVLDGFRCRAGYATDLGRVPEELVGRFERLNLLAIESNYDPELQRVSGRPAFLQHRITGGHGHLSNAQALAAVRAIFNRGERAGHALPSHVVLLHRSRQCNCPNLLRELFERDARIRPRLVLAEQHAPTPWLLPRGGTLAGEQMMLAWG